MQAVTYQLDGNKRRYRDDGISWRLCSSLIRREKKYDNYIFNEDSFSQEAEPFLFNTLSDFTTKAFAKGLPAQSMIALIEILSLMLPTNAQAKPLITAHRLFHRPCAF